MITKDAPAFDLYAERWSHGTRHLSKVERCDYMDLLCYQWTEQGLPGDLEAIARIIGYKKGSLIPSAVLDKFPLCDDGKRRNKRLETIRAEQRARIQKKSDQRRAAAMRRWHGETSENDAKDMQPQCDRITPALRQQCPPPTTHHPPISIKQSIAREGADSWPSQEDVVNHGKTIGASREVCESFWLKCEGQGWQTDRGVPIHDWRPLLVRFKTSWQSNTHRKNPAPQRNVKPGEEPPAMKSL